jgi:hypothetical protein
VQSRCHGRGEIELISLLPMAHQQDHLQRELC